MRGVRCKVRDLGVLEIYQLLLQSYKAKPFREKNKAYDKLVDTYASLLKGKSYPAVQWFFTNVSKAMRKNYKSLKVKTTTAYWSGNVAGIGARKVVDVLDFFEKNGYITIYTGSRDLRCNWKSYPTIVKFNDKLYDLIDAESLSLYIPDERLEFPIVIKDRKTKENVEFEVTETISKMEKELNNYNDSFRDVLIEFNGELVPSLEYKRSFSGDLYKGGRLFAHGGSVQLLPEKYRLEYLTLDKEPVVEIDYKAIHPNMMYEMLALDNPHVYKLAKKGFDPYSADSSFIEVDEKAIAVHKMKFNITSYNPVRKLYKRSLLMAINCQSAGETRNAINQELFKDSKLDECDREFVGVSKPNVGMILDALCEHNVLISEYFYKDYGVVLQNLDSKIALRVIEILLQEGQTCLAYHDSFAVKSSVEPLLEFAMKEAWKDILGENKFCFIDKK
jgi:hypothetical protein